MPSVLHAALDDTGNLVMMHGDTLCYIYGIPHFRLNWYTTLTLEDGPSGQKLIKQQHDHLLAAETFVYQLPLVGKWFEMVIPRVCLPDPAQCACSLNGT